MTISPAELVPLATAALYLWLLALACRRGIRNPSIVPFRLFLALLATTAITSIAWHATRSTGLGEGVLRIEMAAGMLNAPAFLTLVAASSPGGWARRLQRLSAGASVLIGIATLSGAADRVLIFHVDGTRFDPALAYSALAVLEALYLSAFIYGGVVHRSERDPFERNRSTYVLIATVLVAAGAHTNLIPALQQLPVDQACNALAAVVLFYCLIRYRLFDLEIAVKRGLIQATAGVAVAPFVIGALVGLDRLQLGVRTLPGVIATLGLMPIAAVAGYGARIALQNLADRLLVGHHMDPQEANRTFAQQANSVRSLRTLGGLLVETCQAALQSRCVTVLLDDQANTSFMPVAVSGPLSRPPRPISRDNTLLRSLLMLQDIVTPWRLAQLTVARDHTKLALAEFEPYRDCLIEPLIARDTTLGLLLVGPRVYDEPFAMSDLALLHGLSQQAAVMVENVRLLEQLRASAETDFLTGLPNHRRLQDLLDEQMASASHRSERFCLAIVDIDNFKLLNDVHGHLAGDEALRLVAKLFRASVRPGDVVGRYGGDEFLFLLPNTAAEEGARVMARVARRIHHLFLETSGDLAAAPRIPIRISWGLASFPEHGTGIRGLIASADSDLRQRRYRLRGQAMAPRRSPRHGSIGADPQKATATRLLLSLIETKDAYTIEHSQQVASLTLALADELRLSEEERETLWLGALLHDIGKIGVSDLILRKPGLLTAEEQLEMRRHPAAGAQLVLGVLDKQGVAAVVAGHHEHFDGSGYPLGLAGHGIPKLARAVAVVDAFSAMVHDRPYRKGLTAAEAVAELRQFAGAQFDPEMVEAFTRTVARDSTVVSGDRAQTTNATA